LKQVRGIKYFVIIFLLSVFACSSLSKDEKEKLAHLYVDLLTVEEFYHGIPDSIKSHQQKLFEEYRISAKEYLEQIKKMKEDKDEWEEFFALADSYLKLKSGENKKLK